MTFVSYGLLLRSLFLFASLCNNGLFATELPLVVEPSTQPLRATVQLNGGQLVGRLGVSSKKDSSITPCDENNKDGDCWQWSDGKRLEIQDDPRSVLCKTVAWPTLGPEITLEDCWDFKVNSSWFGGGSLNDQVWPIQTAEVDDVPQVTGGGTMEGSWNNIHNRLWFSTSGFAIKVEDNVPLFVKLDPKEQKLYIRAVKRKPYRYEKNDPTVLSYSVCYSTNLTTLYLGVMAQFFKPPSAVPDLRLFRSAIWNTWPKFKSGMDVTSLTEYSRNISTTLGAAGSLLVIGRNWETCIGDHQFRTASFPNAKGFIDSLKSKFEMEVSLWVHPQMSTQCQSYEDGLRGQHLVTDGSDQALTTEWRGNNVSSVNFLSEGDTVDWWTKRLKYLKEQYDVASFFFDNGQVSYLPENYFFEKHTAPLELQPDAYSTKYVDVAATFGNMAIVNVGRNTQHYPLFVRMPEKLGGSYAHDGLKSVIPSILQMGISGFPFVLPEVIGGSFSGDTIPDRRLYIRWLELSAFLPAVHFSVGPWEYDVNVTAIAKTMMANRANYIDDIIRLAESSRYDGAPIIRPIWWICPDDPKALGISDQFLVGNSLLVAPVVDDRDERDIYLPAGQWKDNIKKKTVTGGRWFYNYKVPLEEIAYFDKMA